MHTYDTLVFFVVIVIVVVSVVSVVSGSFLSFLFFTVSVTLCSRQEDAVQHSTMVETQLSALQTELRAAREASCRPPNTGSFERKRKKNINSLSIYTRCNIYIYII